MQLSFSIIAAAIVRTVASGLIYTQSSIDDAVDHTPIVRDLNSNAILNSPRPAQGFDDDDQASAIDWATYTNKGGAFMCGLLATDQSAGQLLRDARTPPSAASLWRGDLKQELSTWYWHVNGRPTYNCKLDDYWYIASVATEAYYEFGINTKGGAIFNFYLESPKFAASSLWYNSRKDADPGDLPQLRALSDILWGYWNRDNPNIKNIRYFFMIGIANPTTNQLIASILHNAGRELSEWPGASFATATDEGHALLGSPNGAAFAYFLMQHKAELGYKIITKVTVFQPDTDDPVDIVDPSLVFHVEEAPEPPAEGAVGTTRDSGAKHIMDQQIG
ncbi:hypothetical protein N0V83_003205 [Neocucurbitaria cava]|uniref:Uncharacterized protein n=1 Tax=Neocucurbitaria cava TaxID=798079 RepID=A0A9W9CNA3_9PLEO|nr:hypothetical protein N0V83_003205 [Neocucurbitaria cava]